MRNCHRLAGSWVWAAGLAGLLASSGCTFVNERLNPLDLPVAQRARNHTRSALIHLPDGGPPPAKPPAAEDGWFVGLAISGGGSRSANYAAAVMFELQRHGLLERVDAISSVSGGSLTAAYYCVAPDGEWNLSAVQKKLSHEFASDMVGQFFIPWKFCALTFSDLDRSDLLADSLNQNLYTLGGRVQTFADLRADRPRLYINATDLQDGKKFVFCNESFDAINSDLAGYPLGYAAAASSSVPVVLHQVTLRDFSTEFEQYRHLVDGGIVDNLGVLTLLETYQANNAEAERRAKEAAARGAPQPPRSPYHKGAVLIIIDAGTRFNTHINDRGDVGLIEGLGAGAKLSTAKLINRASSATLSDLIVKYAPDAMTAEQIRRDLAQLEEQGVLRIEDRQGRPLTIVHIALSHVTEIRDAPAPDFAQSIDAIDTYFNISDADAYNLYKAAHLIVEQKYDGELDKLRRGLEGAAPTSGPAPAAARAPGAVRSPEGAPANGRAAPPAGPGPGTGPGGR